MSSFGKDISNGITTLYDALDNQVHLKNATDNFKKSTKSKVKKKDLKNLSLKERRAP